MKTDRETSNQDRREFIRKGFSSCALCCFALPNLISSNNAPNVIDDDNHKFLKDSGMSLEAVYNFAFKWWYIPAMRNIMGQLGKKEFIKLLKKSSEKIQADSKFWDNNFPVRSMSVWINYIKKANEAWDDRLTFEIIKENEKEFEVRFTECLWAKTFREAKASEIGYAGVCYQDYGMTEKFSPKLELIREKTLMEGNDCCEFKWSWKG
jgi:hypothetical protein